jgi:hypothetical protein
MAKRVAILQSNYIPWKGYFDLIAAVDEFILFDDMQYTRRDWRNRNKIKTPQGLQWLTVPVESKGKYHQAIRETQISNDSWAKGHWRGLVQNYRRADHFDEIAEWLEPLYAREQPSLLSELNRSLLEAVNAYLGISTSMTNSWDYDVVEGKTERLVSLCVQAGGTDYVSGPAARDYLDEQAFAEAGIGLSWFGYSGYPEYPQQWGAFEHGVTVLDLLFNCGSNAPEFMKYVQR